MRLKIILLTGLGFLSLIMGTIGLFLPIWPTTPFVLASAACFSSSPRLRVWLLRLPFFKDHIENYTHRTGLSPKIVIKSLSFLWGMLLLSMVLFKSLWLCLLLIVVGSAVTIHILWMAKTKEKDGKK
jgi:uncharacterized membrane protein YbaN (DUF454 family)